LAAESFLQHNGYQSLHEPNAEIDVITTKIDEIKAGADKRSDEPIA